MDKSAFSKNKPGKLIRIKKGVWGFYPNTLPPEIEPNWSLAQSLHEAGEALGNLRAVAERFPHPRMATGLIDRADAVISCRMGGISASLQDLLLYEHTGSAASDDVIRVDNLSRAAEKGVRALSDLPLSLSLAQDIHENMFAAAPEGDTAPGKFRGGKSASRGAGKGSGLLDAYTPPPEAQMKVALFALDKFLRKPPPLPLLVRLALVFYQFNAIRPFNEGNNRLVRLLPGLALRAEHASPYNSLLFPEYIEKHPGDFTERFMGVVHKGEWQEWIIFFINGIKEQARALSKKVASLAALRKAYHEKLREGRSSALLPVLTDELFISPAITTAGAAERLRVTFRAAQINIDKLVETGVLREATGKKRNRVYIAPETLAIFE